MARHEALWTTPSPFWPLSPQEAETTVYTAFRQPAILRFTTDSFMEDFLATLQTDPLKLREYRAKPESWDGRAATPESVERVEGFRRRLNKQRLARERQLALSGKAEVAETILSSASQTLPLKLFQPAHQRYYLVAACLVCGVVGLPNRSLNSERQERVSYVVRRLVPRSSPAGKVDPSTCDEFAFVSGADEKRWEPIGGRRDVLVKGEEQERLFPVTYQDYDGRKRRLFAGLVPVTKRDVYLSASDGSKTETKIDPRLALLKSRVLGPWQEILNTAEKTRTLVADPQFSGDHEKTAGLIAGAQDDIQVNSWYLLLDFSNSLRALLPSLAAVVDGNASEDSLSKEETDVLKVLQETMYRPPHAMWRSLASALREIQTYAFQLETVKQRYKAGQANPGWPAFLFAFGSPQIKAFEVMPKGGLEGLEALLVKAFAANAMPAGVPPLPEAARPGVDTGRPAWFTIRCVYDHPECGPLATTVVSDPSAPFQLAGFFDPEAPARPIRIMLPVDTTPAGLRKFDKNTAFVASDILCGQLKSLGKLSLGDLVRSVLPFPLHKDLSIDDSPCKDSQGNSQGTVCSLSIPIVTICALVLLIIIVSLLDFVFHWLPFFKFCFPLPGFKAKE